MNIVTRTREVNGNLHPPSLPTPHPVLVRLVTQDLIKALHNYRQITTGRSDDVIGLYEMSEPQVAFYEKFGVPMAVQAIWQGR
jgi:hypothetical protein